jgi:saccharopine dehydrogenase-like NADP-dependent oxidoreductase
VKPRELFYKVFGDKLAEIEDQDMCVVRAVGVGKKAGKEKKMQIDIFDKEDEVTKFTSMERLTGFSAAIYANEIAHGNVEPGCIKYECAVTGTKFVDEIQKRGIKLRFS